MENVVDESRCTNNCTYVTGSCGTAFVGAGSCIDVRTGDLSNIDILVKLRGGLCLAAPHTCCKGFKLKTEGEL